QAQPGRGPGGFGRGGAFGMGGPGMGGLVALAALPPIQKDVGLDGIATGKIQKLSQDYFQEMQSENEKAGLGFGAFGQLQDLSPEERNAKMRELNDKRTEISKKLNGKFVPQLKETLSAAQFERLQQISWQAARSHALSEAEVVKALE